MHITDQIHGDGETQSDKNKICVVKVRILHALHNLRYKRGKQEKPLLLRSCFTPSRAHSLFSRAVSHVWPVHTLFPIRLITNCVRN